MKQSVNMHQFERAFVDMGREDQFSYEALQALFNYFEELENEGMEEIELDVIAICCDFTEYESEEELESAMDAPIWRIEQDATVIELPSGGYVIQNY